MLRRLLPVALIAAVAAPALAQNRGDFRWEKALPAGNEVAINNINGDITVIPSTTGKVEVVGIKRGSSQYFDRIRADVQQTSRGVVICVLDNSNDSYCDEHGMHSSSNRNNRGDRDWNNVSMSLEIAVPTNLQVSASSVSGDVSITGATGDVRANSVSGNIKLDRLRASAVSANTVSGDVEVSIQEFTGRGDLKFNTVSGDVTLDLPRQLDVDLSMSTVSGDINSDYALTLGNGRMNRRSIDARIGAGGRHLDLNTVSGSVKLRANR
jgi:hypothetical protein